MAASVVTGTYVGTGAAINIELGFKPNSLRIINTTDGDVGWTWFDTMADGTAISEGAALATVASNGVTPYDGDRDTAKREGFTVGTALSESGKTFAYMATRDAGD